MKRNMHYLNGEWVSSENLTISAFDLSVIRGFGVFDFLRTYRHVPFLLHEHVDRFFESAKQLGLAVPKNKQEICSIVMDGIEKNAYTDYNIRVVLTGGVGEDAMTPGASSLIVMFTQAKDYPSSYYEKGVKVIAYPHERVFAGAKTLNYLTGIVALQSAKKANAVEAIYTDQHGHILEGTTSNFFVVIKGVLVTPKDSILKGITRRVIINIAKKAGVSVEERTLNINKLNTFDEAFIAASNKEVMPVVMIDKTQVGRGTVGPVTKRLSKQYVKLTGRLKTNT